VDVRLKAKTKWMLELSRKTVKGIAVSEERVQSPTLEEGAQCRERGKTSVFVEGEGRPRKIPKCTMPRHLC